MNDRLVQFTKAWNYKDGQSYGEKPYLFNPELEMIKGIEPCKLRKNGESIECTKIFYTDNTFVVLVGSIEEFVKTCRDANLSICLLHDLYAAGITIKEFMKQTERLNGIEFS